MRWLRAAGAKAVEDLGSTAGRSGSEDASSPVGCEEERKPFTFQRALGEVAD